MRRADSVNLRGEAKTPEMKNPPTKGGSLGSSGGMRLANSFHLNRPRLSSGNSVSANGSACADFTPFPWRVALQPEGEAMPASRPTRSFTPPPRESFSATDARARSTATPRRGSCTFARALMRRTEKGKAYGADHGQSPCRPRGASVGLPQRPQRPLLPVL